MTNWRWRPVITPLCSGLSSSTGIHMSRAYSKRHISAEVSVAFGRQLKYTDGPGSFDSNGGGRLQSGIRLLSYPMSDHLKPSIGSQPASCPPSAGEMGWTRGGL